MFDEYDRLFKRMSRSLGLDGVLEGFGDAGSPSGPFYYGYTVAVGPDGRPIIREYGNVGPAAAGQPGPSSTDGRAPMVETIADDKDGTIKLVAEMPGVEKSDIKVVVDTESVDISAEHGEKKYSVSVPVKGDSIDGDSGKATYKNGILEVSFKRTIPKPSGKTLEVN